MTAARIRKADKPVTRRAVLLLATATMIAAHARAVKGLGSR